MAEDNKLVIEAVLDTTQAQRAFADIRKSGQDSAKKIGSAFNASGSGLSGLNEGLAKTQGGFTSFGSSLSRLALPLLGLTAALATVKKGFDLILEGEKSALELNIFNAAAQRAGVNAENLLKNLENANAGIGDVGEISKIAALGLNELGSEAEKYPELLEVARKLSIQFGKDVTTTFQELNQAVLSGRTRGLGSQFGVFIDQEKALRDYAKSIGTVSSALTEQEKRVATLNAVLEQSRITTAGVNLQNETLGVNLARLQTSFVELTKSIGSRLFDVLGTDVKTLTREFANFFDILKGFIEPQTETEKLTERLKKVNEQIALTSKQSEFLGSAFNLIFGRSAQSTIASYNDELIKISTRLGQLNQQATKQASVIALPVATGLSEEEQAIRLDNLNKFNVKLAEANKTARDAEFAARLAQATSQEEIYQIEIERLSIESATRLQQLDNELSQLRFISEQEKNELRLAEVDRFNSEVLKLQANQTNSEVAELKKRQDLVKQINSAIIQSLVNTTSQGLQALGASLVQGGAAFENFGAQVLNILGDLLINVGQAILAAQFAALELFKSLANPANAFFGIASAAALIALGGALKAVSSAKASGVSSPAPAPTFGGGVTDTGGFPAQPTIRDEDRERRTSQDVSVVINGDVLDSDDSGIRIVDLINRAFDKQGVTVRRGIA